LIGRENFLVRFILVEWQIPGKAFTRGI